MANGDGKKPNKNYLAEFGESPQGKLEAEQAKRAKERAAEASFLEKRNKIPVILNTSFNIKGMPILTTIEDALYCLDNTEMDYVVIEGWLFKRKSK